MGRFRYIRAEEFFRNARSTTIGEDVRREVERDYNSGPITISEAYRIVGINGEAWSELGGQVFGEERTYSERPQII